MTDESDRNTELEAVAELAKRRGFFFQSSGAYGGVSGFFTYGPQGAALKRNLEDAWRDRYVTREGHMEVSAPDVMPEPVFEASGHLDGFDDMIIECPHCGESHRADHLVEDNSDVEDAEAIPIAEVQELIAELDLACPSCGAALAGEPVEEFNLMFETSIGPGSSQPGYLRPETAQGIFVEFPRLKEYARGQLPFGVAQIGNAYRNEISPRRALVRVREFTQAELEHFIDPEEDEPDIDRVADVELPLYSAANQNDEAGGIEHLTVREALDREVITSPWVAYYLGLSKDWYERVGVDMSRFRYRQHLAGERAHYAADCWDAEAELGGDWVEITGFAYRSDYDLSKHAKHSGGDFTIFKQYDEPKTVERPVIDVDMSWLGPKYGDEAPEIEAAIEESVRKMKERDPEMDVSKGFVVEFEDYGIETEADEDGVAPPEGVVSYELREETVSGEHITPHVVEPSFGVGRLVYTVLTHAYGEDEVDGETRRYLSVPTELAPTFACVAPLVSNDEGLVERAEDVLDRLRGAGFEVDYDDSGSIGRRYRRQDEVGTPFCVTVDHETLEQDEYDAATVTVRDRDSTEQARVRVGDLVAVLSELRAGETTFAALLDEPTVHPVE